MLINELTKEFSLNLKRIGNNTQITFNNIKCIVNDDEMDDIRHNLVNLSHALMLFEKNYVGSKAYQ